MKTKMLVLVGIAVCAVLLTSPGLANADYSKIYGNANEDDVLDMRDTTYIKLVIFGKKPATDFADANYDGKISMLDVGQTKLIILGKEKELTLVDQADRVVTVPRPIERIVAVSPNTVKTIIALGACDKLVATSECAKWCACYGYSAAVTAEEMPPICVATVCGGRLFELPEVSGTSMSLDNIELAVSLKPDLIFDSSSSADATQEKTGTPTVVIISSGHDLDRMYKEFETMGVVLEKEQEAEELISFVKEKVAKLEEVTSEIPESDKPRVFFATRIHGTYIGRVTSTMGPYYPIDIAGGINVAKGISGSTVLKEQIIAWNPDIIIVAYVAGAAGDPVEMVLSDPDLQTVNAVKNKSIYYTSYAYCWGTPQDINFVAAFYLAKLFHPEKFEDLDVEKEGNEIFEAFLGVDGFYSEYADYTGWLREFLESQ